MGLFRSGRFPARLVAAGLVALSVPVMTSSASGAVPASTRAFPPGTSAYVPLAPCRLADTRAAGGAMVPNAQRQWKVSGAGLGAQGGALAGCGVPAGATAAEVSVSVVGPSASGYVRVWPAGQAAPNSTFVNYSALQSTTNTGTVKLSAGGAVSVRNVSATTHVVVDIQGYFTSYPSETLPSGASVFVPLGGCRIVDTRVADGAMAPNAQRQWNVAGAGLGSQGGAAEGCGVPVGATAAEVSVSAVGPSANGYVRVWPAGQGIPNSTFVNYTAHQSTTNTGTVSLSAAGAVSVKNVSATSHIVIDVQGYYVPANTEVLPDDATVYLPLNPCRIADTRNLDGPLDPGESLRVGVGYRNDFSTSGGSANCDIDAELQPSAAELSVSAVGPTAAGFMRAWAPYGGRTTVVNYTRHQSTTNTAALELFDMVTDFENTGAKANLVVDLQGYFLSVYYYSNV